MRATSISQFIYKYYLVRNISDVLTAVKKWSISFNDLMDRDWRRIFDMPRFTVSEAKLQYFPV